MQRDRDLDSWRVFCAVAEAGSVSGACDAVDMDASGVSRIIRGLESALGDVTLFDRSIRPLRLTENGETALIYAKRMLESHRNLIESLDKDPHAMRGTIHIGFPPLVLQKFLLPFLISFHEDFPEVVLKVDEYAGSTPVSFDTPRGRLDVICGYGADPSHPNIVQIHYGNGYLIPCASPMYLERRGVPKTPADLIHHTGIIFDSPMRPQVRFLQKDGITHNLQWRDTIQFDSAGSAMNAALYGAGIHPGISTLHCFEAISKGELCPILPGWMSPTSKLYIYARSEAVRLKRTQVFIERFRAYMDDLHHRCEETLKPYVGELQLAVSRRH